MEPLGMNRFPYRGEFDVERRALAGCGPNINFSSVLFNNAVADGEAETGAAPGGFGGEKRIEDAVDVIARNACPGVDDFDFDAAVVSSGTYFKHAAARHRIARIQK